MYLRRFTMCSCSQWPLRFILTKRVFMSDPSGGCFFTLHANQSMLFDDLYTALSLIYGFVFKILLFVCLPISLDFGFHDLETVYCYFKRPRTSS